MSAIPESLLSFYKKHLHGQPPTSRVLSAIQSLLNGTQTFIIIDALDECPNNGDEREDLCAGLEEIHMWANPNLHLLVTSRKEVDLCNTLGHLVTLHPISIQGGIVESDIRKYVTTQLAVDSKLKKWPTEIKEEIERTLVGGAQGM